MYYINKIGNICIDDLRNLSRLILPTSIIDHMAKHFCNPELEMDKDQILVTKLHLSRLSSKP